MKKHLLEAIVKQSRDGRIDSSTPWIQLRHTINRLRAYRVSAETLVSSYENWPELFENFRVTILPSSKPHPNPIKKLELTAYEIIGRMVPTEEEKSERRADAEKLQRFGLDKIIQTACSSDTFTPLVHAEVLVHDSVRTYLTQNPGMKYWNDWNFVGASKPCCRLCTYYFSHINDVSVRESHGNLYSKWRLPDVFDEQSAKRRNNILNKIAERIRLDALRTMISKLPQGKRDDSSSYPTVASWFREAQAVEASVSGVSSMLSGMSLSAGIGVSRLSAQIRRRRSYTGDVSAQSASSTEDDEEDDVLLFTGRSHYKTSSGPITLRRG